jgi:hypothetical protein
MERANIPSFSDLLQKLHCTQYDLVDTEAALSSGISSGISLDTAACEAQAAQQEQLICTDQHDFFGRSTTFNVPTVSLVNMIWAAPVGIPKNKRKQKTSQDV